MPKMSQLEEYRKIWSRYPDLDNNYYFDQLTLSQIKKILDFELLSRSKTQSKELSNATTECDDGAESNSENGDEYDSEDEADEDDSGTDAEATHSIDPNPPAAEVINSPEKPYVIHGISYCLPEVNTQQISFDPNVLNKIILNLNKSFCPAPECRTVSEEKYFGSPQYEVLVPFRWYPKKSGHSS
jgi:hypothetical protein